MSDAFPSIDDPREVYEDRMKIRRRVAAIRRRTEGRISMVRLVLFLLAAGLAWPALFTDIVAWGWIFVPVGAFVAVALWHARVIRQRELDERGAVFYERGLERLADRWAGQGNSGQSYLRADHAYAADLDIFGRGSLFELICAARTGPGEAMLAGWLSSPAPPATVRARQAAVEELRPRLDLRERLALVGEDVRAELDADDLTQWASGEPLLTERWPVIVAAALGVANLATLLASLTVSVVFPVFLVSAVVSGSFALVFRRRVVRVLIQVDRPEHELELLGAILAGLESESFRSPLLAELRSNLDTRGLPPSRRIAALARLVQINDSRRNMFFAPLAALTLHGDPPGVRSRALEASVRRRYRALAGRGRRDRGAVVPGRLFVRASGRSHARGPGRRPALRRSGDRAPAAAEAACVRNDVRLGDDLQLMLVSGSNMSGKSTLLRTVGVNVVLALAGGPVRAGALRVSPLAVGASMRVTDSLQEGLSHFYAEIKRLSTIVEIGEGSPPLLFLLDEILHGTNSHDRRIGAEALFATWSTRGASAW